MRLQPTTTSYDYDSPIAEDGTLTAKFTAFRSVTEQHLGAPLPEPPGPAPRLPEQSVPCAPPAHPVRTAWRAGANEVIICELVQAGSQVALVAGPDLGSVAAQDR